jgi:ABC-type long-subunit fatty acid transport system fused permease/ATPase subunit
MQLNAAQGGGMPLIQLVIVLIVVGVVLWLINTYIPMEATIKKILNAVVIIAVILWLLTVFGVVNSLSGIRVGR